jgi:hypothetical protein
MFAAERSGINYLHSGYTLTDGRRTGRQALPPPIRLAIDKAGVRQTT